MKIDWFTVVAQGINFLVLLWLMKRFLYKPILNAIDERERRISEELANAETEKTEAKKQKEEYEAKNGELEGKRAAFLKNARDEGQAEKMRLLTAARDEADALRLTIQEALVEEKAASRQVLRQRIQNGVLIISRKVLADLAGASLEERVAGVFNQRLQDLDGAEIKKLTLALQTRPEPIVVRTAFDLKPELRATIEASIKELFGSDIKVMFESAPELISGMELSVNGQKLAWSIADYLGLIHEELGDLLWEKGEGEKRDPIKKSL